MSLAESRKELSKTFVKFRQDLRTLLAELGVPSNPAFTEDNIVTGFRQAFERQAEAHKEVERLRAEVERAQNYNAQSMYERDDLRAKLAECERERDAARVAGMKVALQILLAEPEFPGEMPDEMWAQIKGDKDATAECLRISVRLTKSNVAEAIQALITKVKEQAKNG